MSTSKICRDLDKLHPYAQQQALKVLVSCKEQGLSVGIFETLRTEERQKWLLANGKSKTMNSYHRLGLAVDFVFLTKNGNWTWRKPNSDWDALAKVIESHGFYSLWKRKGWDGPHGQINIKGLPVRTMYKNLNEAEGDLNKFWEDTVNPALREQDLWAKAAVEVPAPEDEPSPPAPPEPGYYYEVQIVEHKEPAPTLLQQVITFFTNLFGGSK